MTKKIKGNVRISRKVANKLGTEEWRIYRKNGIISFGCGAVKWSKKDLLILLKALPTLKKMDRKNRKDSRMPSLYKIYLLTPSELRGIIG